MYLRVLGMIDLNLQHRYFLIDSITLAAAPPPPVQSTYEAENGIFSGGVSIDTSQPGYSGTGFVSGFTTSSDTVSIVVNAASYAVYDLSVRYISLYGEKKTSLSINGVASGEIDLPGATTFATASAGEVLLNAGSNIIAFTDDWGYALTRIKSRIPYAPYQVLWY